MCARSRRCSKARIAKLADHPLVGDARAVGLIGALEMVADKKTGKRLRSEAGRRRRPASDILQEMGVITARDGRLASPSARRSIITEAEINEMFDIVEKGLDRTEAWVKKENLRAA